MRSRSRSRRRCGLVTVVMVVVVVVVVVVAVGQRAASPTGLCPVYTRGGRHHTPSATTDLLPRLATLLFLIILTSHHLCWTRRTLTHDRLYRGPARPSGQHGPLTASHELKHQPSVHSLITDPRRVLSPLNFRCSVTPRWPSFLSRRCLTLAVSSFIIFVCASSTMETSATSKSFYRSEPSQQVREERTFVVASLRPSIDAPSAAFAPSQVRWRRYSRQVILSTCWSFQRDGGVPTRGGGARGGKKGGRREGVAGSCGDRGQCGPRQQRGHYSINGNRLRAAAALMIHQAKSSQYLALVVSRRLALGHRRCQERPGGAGEGVVMWGRRTRGAHARTSQKPLCGVPVY
ncbi:hypothetical protein E2C01_056308 [Portunus trituberculatus]|uniref:Uncharacterized protein n=1 Tax=Portunus trituberculatus TaxID=210409 RepID=A0A5B7H065_PORTR|nr:hypothetical protein [Portunus trituberculatus]